MAHHPGKFVWFELGTKNLENAKRFYGELFGWKVTSAPMGGVDYQLINLGETQIGGLVALEGSHLQWHSYLSVANVDETAKKAKKGGGKVIREAQDIPNVGRFALLSDPQGGLLYAFHSEKSDADDREAKHGDFYWNEL